MLFELCDVFRYLFHKIIKMHGTYIKIMYRESLTAHININKYERLTIILTIICKRTSDRKHFFFLIQLIMCTPRLSHDEGNESVSETLN